MAQASTNPPSNVKPENILKGMVFTNPRWKSNRQVTGVSPIRWEGKTITRVEYIDLRTSRTGWAELGAFVGAASLTSSPPVTEIPAGSKDAL